MAKTANSKRRKLITTIVAAAGLGIGGYALYRINQGKPVLPSLPGSQPDAITPDKKTDQGQVFPKVGPVVIKRQWINAGFPMQKGMQGDLVGQLQVWLNKLGKMKITGDGKFGDQTLAALKALGYSTPLSNETYLAIRAKATAPPPPSAETPYQRLVRMKYNVGTEIEPAISLRKEVTSAYISDSAVKKLLSGSTSTVTNISRAYKSLYGSSLADDLKNASAGRLRFNDQITRLQALSGFAGLTGLSQVPQGPEIKTIVRTQVKSLQNGFIPVAQNVILGTFVSSGKNLVLFMDHSGEILRVPASDISKV
ncbi:MAG: peptidoglycan-binding domain-containing protein [Bacteroidota bacterium]